ncbi:uncharacterized protein DEA37_0003472 [Paragonimus westermani]|uniref:IRS-type PTB domain-containing protein n=1 Tax=Paragonimus westermani TaxID=34504 RepID=A0A5J4NJ00_9TREM|nr:uncharacterized protein DEA37_0003472 [Paragonimus westermani]
MGGFHSLLNTPSCRYSHNTRLNETQHCSTCGTAYHPAQVVSSTTQPVWFQAHYPAVLCGICLGRPDEEQLWEGFQTTDRMRDSFSTSSQCYRMPREMNLTNTLPSTTLPKRAQTNSKPPKVVDILLKHTDFTKGERSALKRGFFSTIDVTLDPLAELPQFEGCHIHGCIFVEYGNLVFQAAEDPTTLPVLLIKQMGTSFGNGFLAAESPSGYNQLHSRGSDLNVTLNGAAHSMRNSLDVSGQYRTLPSSASLSLAIFRTTKRKLMTYLRTGCSSVAKHRCSCRSCRVKLSCKSDFVHTKIHDNYNCAVNKPMPKPKRESSPEATANYLDSTRLPPPPLRLSWPLYTLRRFGFYGSSLFKLEAGRRAPRGEGNYLFLIKGLKEFRQYFEKYVHRRKSASPLPTPQQYGNHTVQSSTLFHDSKHRLSSPSSRHFQSDLHVASLLAAHPGPKLPPHDEQLSSGQSPSPYNTSPRETTDIARFKKKKASSISTPGKSNLYDPDGNNHLVSLQHDHRKLQVQSNPRQNSHLQTTAPGSFPSSCPQLTESYLTHTSPSRLLVTKVMDRQKQHADEIATLPDAPAPPVPMLSLNLTDHLPPLPQTRTVYDNVNPYWHHPNLNLRCSSQTPFSSCSTKPDMTREWLDSLSTYQSGRVYTSRRAMTAVVRSNRCVEEMEGNGDSESHASANQQIQCNPSSSDQVHSPRLARRNRAANGCQVRHASLPTPIPLPDLSSQSQNENSLHVNSPRSLVLSPIIVSKSNHGLLLGSYHQQYSTGSPYYNLNNPEALHHISRTKSLTRSGSTNANGVNFGGYLFKEPGLISSPLSCAATLHCRQTRFGGSPDCSPSTSCTHHDYVNPERDTPIFRFSDSQLMDESQLSCSTTVRSTESHSQPIRLEPYANISGTLHYATLDFGHSLVNMTDPSNLVLFTGGTHSTDFTNTAGTNAASERSHSESSSSSNCPAHTYRTLVVSNALTQHDQGQSAGTSESVAASSNVDSDQAGGELPTNYVAICQLQTLAMRAVLNATT